MNQLAVIKTGGKQYLVSPGDKIKIEKIEADKDGNVVFDQVLLLEKDKEVKIGTPFLSGVKVLGKNISNGKGKKIIVFKYKPKKRYKVKKGHRQSFSEIEIIEIKS